MCTCIEQSMMLVQKENKKEKTHWMWTMNDVRPSPTYVLVAGKQGLPFSVYSPAGQGLVGLGNCGTWMDPVMFSQRHKIFQRLHKPIYQHAQNWHLSCRCSAPAPKPTVASQLERPWPVNQYGLLKLLVTFSFSKPCTRDYREEPMKTSDWCTCHWCTIPPLRSGVQNIS